VRKVAVFLGRGPAVSLIRLFFFSFAQAVGEPLFPAALGGCQLLYPILGEACAVGLEVVIALHFVLRGAREQPEQAVLHGSDGADFSEEHFLLVT
jgi:hypothetical protein